MSRVPSSEESLLETCSTAMPFVLPTLACLCSRSDPVGPSIERLLHITRLYTISSLDSLCMAFRSRPHSELAALTLLGLPCLSEMRSRSNERLECLSNVEFLDVDLPVQHYTYTHMKPDVILQAKSCAALCPVSYCRKSCLEPGPPRTSMLNPVINPAGIDHAASTVPSSSLHSLIFRSSPFARYLGFGPAQWRRSNRQLNAISIPQVSATPNDIDRSFKARKPSRRPCRSRKD
jgi:hypothetical protein